MQQAEKDIRVQLAACYRIFDYMGWSELIYNHITVKVPGEEGHFLINPYGLHYKEVTASNLVKVDIHGQVVEDTDYAVNPAGMLIHSAIHAAREDAHCIGHIHSTAGMTVACQQEGLRIDNFYSVLLYGQVAYHDFQGITVMDGEKEDLIASLGTKNFLILRSHGLLTCGSTIPDMFLNMTLLQRSCEIQVSVDQTGRPIVPVSEEIGKKTAQLLQLQMQAAEGKPSGELEFSALQRLVDREDDSYRDV
ncbi:class II aldolase/adducin family protein [Arenicella xantha]|uniref:Ribulose-5-phosphate 4-epimerase/fuculose-1-phosphate aldolase n=1 Tax=Arenicella xantha TaxID=644221 RepID=A0A395JLD7_9GAMM|nr:class II aldolase/adducin family protein [Arenicella xantha]RBP51582.1 ribulose-5-phosphate 4-epimerase/fuculose-1-phosphate aldolase [Arenicella xantha]